MSSELGSAAVSERKEPPVAPLVAVGRRPVEPRVRRRERRHGARLDVHHLVLAGAGVAAFAADVVVLRRRRLAGPEREPVFTFRWQNMRRVLQAYALTARRFRASETGKCALRVTSYPRRDLLSATVVYAADFKARAPWGRRLAPGLQTRDCDYRCFGSLAIGTSRLRM